MILNSKYNFLKPFKVKKLIRFGRNFDGGYLVCSDALKRIENLAVFGLSGLRPDQPQPLRGPGGPRRLPFPYKILSADRVSLKV